MSDENIPSEPKKLKAGALVRDAKGDLLVGNEKGDLVPLPKPHTISGDRAQVPRKEPDA